MSFLPIKPLRILLLIVLLQFWLKWFRSPFVLQLNLCMLDEYIVIVSIVFYLKVKFTYVFPKSIGNIDQHQLSSI